MAKLTPRDAMKLYTMIDAVSSTNVNDFVGGITKKSGASTAGLLDTLKFLEDKGIIKFEDAVLKGKGKGRKCIFINEDIKNISDLVEVILNSLYSLFFNEIDYEKNKISPGVFYLLSSENGNEELVEAVKSLLERKRVPMKNIGVSLKVLQAWLISNGSVNEILSNINKPDIEKYETFKKGFDVLKGSKIMYISGERVFLEPSFVSEFVKYKVKVPLQATLLDDDLSNEAEP